MSTIAQTTATPCSPASITVPSPATSTLPYSQATTGSWNVTSSLANNNSGKSQPGDSPAPAHAFQIAMPPSSSSTLTPPPRTSMPGRSSSIPGHKSYPITRFLIILFCHDLNSSVPSLSPSRPVGHCFSTRLVASRRPSKARSALLVFFPPPLFCYFLGWFPATQYFVCCLLLRVQSGGVEYCTWRGLFVELFAPFQRALTMETLNLYKLATSLYITYHN